MSTKPKLTRAQIADRCGVSVRSIIRWHTEPYYAHLNFPKPTKIGFRNALYEAAEFEAWLQWRDAHPDLLTPAQRRAAEANDVGHAA
jgi:predicted DNA-binding transcriptional regulator AlpA